MPAADGTGVHRAPLASACRSWASVLSGVFVGVVYWVWDELGGHPYFFFFLMLFTLGDFNLPGNLRVLSCGSKFSF